MNTKTNTQSRTEPRMPEGPEIKTCCDQLQFITKCFVDSIDYKDSMRVKGLHNIDIGSRVQKVYAYSKKLFIKFSCGYTLVCSYGMNSGWYYERKPHTVVTLTLSYCSDNVLPRLLVKKQRLEDPVKSFGKVKLYTQQFDIFFEIVRFGSIEAIPNDEIEDYLSQFGPDVLHDDVDYDEYLDLMSLKKIQNWELCKLMLDQRLFITGVGNYLRCEIMYRAKIRPTRKIRDLNGDELKRIYDYTHSVMRDSYRSGGLTIESFFPPDGKAGTFKKIVYGQDKDPRGNKVVKEEFSCKRTCHWVPAVQR